MKQILDIVIPSKVGLEIPESVNEATLIKKGFTDLVPVESILTEAQEAFVKAKGSLVGSLYIENETQAFLVQLKTIESGVARDVRIPVGFSARTEEVSGVSKLVGFPAIAGG